MLSLKLKFKCCIFVIYYFGKYHTERKFYFFNSSFSYKKVSDFNWFNMFKLNNGYDLDRLKKCISRVI
jgi:hypothetical protein